LDSSTDFGDTLGTLMHALCPRFLPPIMEEYLSLLLHGALVHQPLPHAAASRFRLPSLPGQKRYQERKPYKFDRAQEEQEGRVGSPGQPLKEHG